MNATDVCTIMSPSLPLLFECAPAPKEGVRVRTPLLYPDGGIVDVFVVERNDGYAVTDFGDALGWLSLQSTSSRRTRKQQLLVEDVCQTLRLDLDHGQLIRRGVSLEGISAAVVEVAQAAVRVSDVWFTMRSQSLQTTAEEVDEWLKERQIDFKARVQKRGRSTRNWTVDFETYVNEQTSLVLLLITGARGAVRRVVERALAGWVDLSHLKESQSALTFVSLFDDSQNVWREEDFGLLEIHSKIARWSRPDELKNILTAR